MNAQAPYRRRRASPTVIFARRTFLLLQLGAGLLVVISFWIGRWSAPDAVQSRDEGGALDVPQSHKPELTPLKEASVVVQQKSKEKDSPGPLGGFQVLAAPTLDRPKTLEVWGGTPLEPNRTSSVVPKERVTVESDVPPSIARPKDIMGDDRLAPEVSPKAMIAANGGGAGVSEGREPASTDSLDPNALYSEVWPSGIYGVQLGAFPRLEGAKAFIRTHRSTFASIGPVFVARRTVGEKNWFRVRVGSFEKRAGARRVFQSIRASFRNAMVVKYR